MDISEKILSDPVNRWVLKAARELDTEIFLVGGYVRDLMRGFSSKDRDFVLNKKVNNIAVKAAKKFSGTFIELKKQKTYRVVFKQKTKKGHSGYVPAKQREVIDFSYLKGSINNDLKERDFNIDAIAWSQERGIIDPYAGRNDIEKRVVKAVRMKNLTDDPLRMLRAYRIAADLGFQIEENTRKYIKHHSEEIFRAARERITEEFFTTLNNINSGAYLYQSLTDSILNNILNSRQQVESTEYSYKKINSLNNNIKLLNSFDAYLREQTGKIKKSVSGREIKKLLNKEISQGLNTLGLLRLSLVLKNHSLLNSKLCFSNAISKAIKDIHRGLSSFNRNITDKSVYKIFKVSGNRIFEIAILAAFQKTGDIGVFYKRAKEYMKLINKTLLNGNDVQKILKIKQGLKIGEILREVKEQQIKGTIKTRNEAGKWIISSFT